MTTAIAATVPATAPAPAATTPAPAAAPVAAPAAVVPAAVDAFLRTVGAEILSGLTPTEEGILGAARAAPDPAVRALTIGLAYAASAAKASTTAARDTELSAAFAARRVHAHIVGLLRSPARWRWALLPTAAVAAAEASTAARLRHEVALASAERRHSEAEASAAQRLAASEEAAAKRLAASEASAALRHSETLAVLGQLVSAVKAGIEHQRAQAPVADVISAIEDLEVAIDKNVAAAKGTTQAPETTPPNTSAPETTPPNTSAPETTPPNTSAEVQTPPPGLSRKQRRAWAQRHNLDPATV